MPYGNQFPIRSHRGESIFALTSTSEKARVQGGQVDHVSCCLASTLHTAVLAIPGKPRLVVLAGQGSMRTKTIPQTDFPYWCIETRHGRRPHPTVV